MVVSDSGITEAHHSHPYWVGIFLFFAFEEVDCLLQMTGNVAQKAQQLQIFYITFFFQVKKEINLSTLKSPQKPVPVAVAGVFSHEVWDGLLSGLN